MFFDLTPSIKQSSGFWIIRPKTRFPVDLELYQISLKPQMSLWPKAFLVDFVASLRQCYPKQL